jgi:outer membrane protein
VIYRTHSRRLGYLVIIAIATSASAQKAPNIATKPWQPDESMASVRGPIGDDAEFEMQTDHVYTLPELIDVAESNNPATKAAWARAKAAANSVGIAKSELYPTLILSAAGQTFLNPSLLYNTFVVQNLGVFETSLKLNYTLLDFGARRSEIAAAKAKLLSANLNFNYDHLLLMEKVAIAYYALLNATGLREAAEVNLKDAQALQNAAEERLRNGLATLPDVFEAKAVAARSNYDLQSAKGNETSAFGDLATILTASPTKPFQIEQLASLPIPETLDRSVQETIETALSNRPDLLALVARSNAAKAEISHAKSAYFPTVEFDGSKGWLRAWGEQNNEPDAYASTRTYEAKLSLKWTIFDGLRRENRVSQAKAEYLAARAEIHEKQDTIADKVYSDYANAQTALEQRQAAVTLLAAGNQSYDAALDSYRDGVRNILDTLSAERELAAARAADVTARTQVLQTFLTLAFRTGELLNQMPQGRTP